MTELNKTNPNKAPETFNTVVINNVLYTIKRSGCGNQVLNQYLSLFKENNLPLLKKLETLCIDFSIVEENHEELDVFTRADKWNTIKNKILDLLNQTKTSNSGQGINET